MNKKIILMFSLLLLVGCGTKDNKMNTNILENDEENIVKESVYVDDNPIKIGIYQDDLNLTREYNTKKEEKKDLVFSVYFTNKDNLEYVNQKNNWHKYYDEYTDINKYKVGFNISFYVGEKKVETNVLGPESLFAFNPYFYIYLYDDINQKDGTFYSHLEENDINDNTIISSIKLYLVEPETITSSIYLTAFTYDEDDFDEFGNYRGISRFTTEIKWTK